MILFNTNGLFAHSDVITSIAIDSTQLKRFNTNDSIQYQSFVCTQWCGYKYCYWFYTVKTFQH